MLTSSANPGTSLQSPRTSETASKGHRFLIELDVSTTPVTVTVWSFDDAVIAAEQYSAIERAIEDQPEKDVVLVTVESLASLRRAYPNYFLDTTAFLEAVEEAIE